MSRGKLHVSKNRTGSPNFGYRNPKESLHGEVVTYTLSKEEIEAMGIVQTKEAFLNLKEEGLTDKQVMEKWNWNNAKFYQWKQKNGLNVNKNQKREAKLASPVAHVEPILDERAEVQVNVSEEVKTSEIKPSEEMNVFPNLTTWEPSEFVPVRSLPIVLDMNSETVQLKNGIIGLKDKVAELEKELEEYRQENMKSLIFEQSIRAENDELYQKVADLEKEKNELAQLVNELSQIRTLREANSIDWKKAHNELFIAYDELKEAEVKHLNEINNLKDALEEKKEDNAYFHASREEFANKYAKAVEFLKVLL